MSNQKHRIKTMWKQYKKKRHARLPSKEIFERKKKHRKYLKDKQKHKWGKISKAFKAMKDKNAK